MKKFSESLREHMKNMINFEKKKKLPITKKELKLHQDANNYLVCEKESFKSSLRIKLI